MTTIIVTGSSGTVGTAVCERLMAEHCQLFCVDVKANPHNSLVNEMTTIADLTRFDEVCASLPTSADMILHFAGHARVPHSISHPELARDNFEMTFNVLEFARNQGIARVLFASSKDVYGNGITYNAEGDVRIEACESPYGASKIACESLLQAYHKCYGIDFLTIRLSNVYGRYDERNRVIPLFARLIQEGKDITVNGADKLLDFIYIDDVTDAVSLCLENFAKVKNQSFNIASGEGTTLLKIAEIIRENLNGSNRILINKSHPGEVLKSVSDITKAASLLNYKPRVGIEAGLKKAIENLKL